MSPPQRFWLGGRPIPPMPKSVCPRKGSVLKIKMSIKMKTFSPLFLLDMLLKGLEGWQPYQHCLHFKYQPQGHSLTACNATQPATHHRPLNPKWPTGSGNRLNLRLLDPLINFCKISFLIRSFLPLEPQKSKMAAWGSQISQRGLTPRFLGAPVNFL